MGSKPTFEQIACRLYDAFLLKCEESDLELLLERLLEIRSEESEHMNLIKRVLVELGADPNVQTPCAELTRVASSGLVQILESPRTSVLQCLDAILIAELTDSAYWDMLVELVEQEGLFDIGDTFRTALADEKFWKVVDC